MTVPSSVDRTLGAIGLVGMPPTLAESLGPLLRASGYDLVPWDEGFLLVPGGTTLDDGIPVAIVVADGAPLVDSPWPYHLPRVAVEAPFAPDDLLSAVALAQSQAAAHRQAREQIARATALMQRVAVLCGEVVREPDEIAAALERALRDTGDYDDVAVALGEATFAPPPHDADRSIFLPIVADGVTRGAIRAALAVERRADPATQRDLLTAIGALVGGYLERRDERERAARLRAEDVRRVEELAAMNEVALATASLDLDQVLAELMPRTLALLSADYCTLVLRDDASERLTIRAAAGQGSDRVVGLTLPEGWTFSRQLIDARTSQRWHPDDAASVRAVSAQMHPETLPHDTIGAPLIVQGRAIGTIVAANRRAAEFSAADLRFLTTIAAQVAVAVENARLYADTLRLARYDALTGLANRRYFLEQLEHAVGTAARYERPLALLMIDLDHFKSVNDTFGHLAGDALLRSVAERLQGRLRRSDLPARYAGDELAVILPETELPGAMTVAESLRAGVAETPLLTGEAMPAWLTLSVGVAAYTPGTTVNDFLRAADSALYFAKQAGRNRVCGPAAAQDALLGATDDLAAILGGGNQAVIEELAAAVDARVAHTAGQGAQVAAVAVALGEALGLSIDALDTLRSAALVHDIGEVAVAPDVLGRAGPLGAREWTLVRAHPRRSYDLLAAVPAFQGALPAILHHHERWDGQGYPDGLAGEAIPRGARILAVADAWIALTTARPYRAALPYSAALAEIAQGAGRQFDPTIAAALPSVIAQGNVSPSLG